MSPIVSECPFCGTPVEREWNADWLFFPNLITDIIKPPAVHNDDAGHRLLNTVLPSQTLAATPTHDSEPFLRCCRVDPHVRASAARCLCRSKSGRRCWATRTATSRRTARRLSWKSFLKRQIASAEKVRQSSGTGDSQTQSD